MSRAAFLFADLAGFTKLTEEAGDEAAADVAMSFCDRVCALNKGHGAEDVKTVGDEVMIRVVDPAAAICLAVDIVDGIGPAHGLPDVRVGLAYGSAAERRGDYFGATVNIAARVVALAKAREVLITHAAQVASGPAAGIEFEQMGVHQLRNVSVPVRLLRARRKH